MARRSLFYKVAVCVGGIAASLEKARFLPMRDADTHFRGKLKALAGKK